MDNFATGFKPLVKALTDQFFPNRITILGPVETEGPSGAPKRVYQPVLGLQDLPAMRDPANIVETSTGTLTLIAGSFTFKLGANYSSSIDTKQFVQDETGRLYRITGITYDSFGLMTTIMATVADPRPVT